MTAFFDSAANPSVPVARLHSGKRSMWRRLVAFLWRRKAVPLRVESPAERALRMLLMLAGSNRDIAEPDPPVPEFGSRRRPPPTAMPGPGVPRLD